MNENPRAIFKTKTDHKNRKLILWVKPLIYLLNINMNSYHIRKKYMIQEESTLYQK